jgi:hypothetical protein
LLIEPIDLAAQPVERPKSRRQLTDIETFIFKVAIVVMAIFATLFVANRIVEARIEQGAALLRENAALLQGGPAFWTMVEKKLYLPGWTALGGGVAWGRFGSIRGEKSGALV